MGTSDETHKQIIKLQQDKARKHLEASGYTDVEFFEDREESGRIFGVRGKMVSAPMEYSVRADNEVFALTHIVRMAQETEAKLHASRKKE